MRQLLQKFFHLGPGGQEMNPMTKMLLSWVKGYNHEKYWHRRNIVVDPNTKANVLWKLYCLYYVKRVDGKHSCSFGTMWNGGAIFLSPPQPVRERLFGVYHRGQNRYHDST